MRTSPSSEQEEEESHDDSQHSFALTWPRKPQKQNRKGPGGPEAGGVGSGLPGAFGGGPGGPEAVVTTATPKVVEKKRKEADSVKISPMPKAPAFRNWKVAVRDEIAGASGDPDASFTWITQIEKEGITIENLASSGEFASLDAKLVAGLAKIVTGDLSRTISASKERMAGTIYERPTGFERFMTTTKFLLLMVLYLSCKIC